MQNIYRSPRAAREVARWCTERLDAWGAPHVARTVRTGLGPTHVVEAGNGAPVVVLAGTNFCASTSLRFLEHAARTHRVVAADFPGQPGLSSPRRTTRAVDLGDWLLDVLHATETRGATVVGHSLGGLVALGAAARNAQVERLLLVAPAGLVRLRLDPEALQATMPWMLRPSGPSARRLLRAMGGPGYEPDPVLVDWMKLVGRTVWTSLAPRPLPDAALRRVRVQVDVVAGRHDVFLPPQQLEQGRRRLRDARLHVVEDAGHLILDERPDAVMAAINDVSTA